MDVILKVYNTKGSNAKYISLFDIHKALGLKIPYARWATYKLRKHDIVARKAKEHTKGRPRVIYFIKVEEVQPILDDLEKRHKVKFR